MVSETVKEELESLKYIYPELEISEDFKSCSLNIQIRLMNPIKLKLTGQGGEVLKEFTLLYLPDIKVIFDLPSEYPSNQAPVIKMENIDKWIGEAQYGKILDELYQIWLDFKDSVIFSCIDYIKTNSENTGFGIFHNCAMEVFDENIFHHLISQNEQNVLSSFELETYLCDICQNEHKGKDSTKFDSCDHIFCNVCLNDYFSHIITRGEVMNIHCPSFECTKSNLKEFNGFIDMIENGRIKNFNEFNSRFFELPLDTKIIRRFLDNDTLIQRYKDLFFMERIQIYRKYFPLRVAECPRSMCSKIFLKSNPDNKLAICPRCSFAFCSDCLHSWHGYINPCSMYSFKIPKDDILKYIEHNGNNPSFQTDTDKEVCSNISFKYGRKIIELAANDYIADQLFEELVKSGDANIVKCPHCLTYTQRSDGCNKMTCSKCQIFFCNLCGDKLLKSDPYAHYNDPFLKCYGKLFHGMEGMPPMEEM